MTKHLLAMHHYHVLISSSQQIDMRCTSVQSVDQPRSMSLQRTHTMLPTATRNPQTLKRLTLEWLRNPLKPQYSVQTYCVPVCSSHSMISPNWENLATTPLAQHRYMTQISKTTYRCLDRSLITRSYRWGMTSSAPQ